MSIKKISENRIIGVTELQKINKTIAPCFFILDKLDENNIYFWNNFLENVDIKTRRMGARTDIYKGKKINTNILNISNIPDNFTGTISLSDGIKSFKISLGLKDPSFDVWICYSIRDNIYDFPEKLHLIPEKIEMVVTILMNNSSEISTHMGIFKNYPYFMYDKLPFLDLSVALHSFGAKASKEIHHQLKYMITRPVNKMREILMKKMNSVGLGKYIYTDYSLNREFIEEIKNKIKKIEEFGNNKTLVRIKENIKNLENKDPRLLIFFIESYIKNKNKFINIKKSNNHILEVLSNKIELKKNNSIEEIDIPPWFISHKNMQLGLYAVAIDIDVLGNMYFNEINSY